MGNVFYTNPRLSALLVLCILLVGSLSLATLARQEDPTMTKRWGGASTFLPGATAERVESLRNPTDKTFEDHTPDGRVHEVYRRHAEAGGTVTVITDITELKRAERKVAEKEAQLHVALDNMPGALVYTDEELNIVACNERFAEMYPVPSGITSV